jgi:hypothetical protein
MDKDTIFIILMVGFILYICYKLYSESDMFQLKCIVSTVDGDKYCVRERDNMLPAVDLLAKTSEKMTALVTYANDTDPNDERVKRLVSKFNANKIVETLPTSEYTAYSENKGRKIAFCLNKEKEDNNHLIDENTLMFVAIHEMAHITTLSIGHTEEFWDNFRYLLAKADECKVYRPVDYSKEQTEYCGMTISDNPYFN